MTLYYLLYALGILLVWSWSIMIVESYCDRKMISRNTVIRKFAFMLTAPYFASVLLLLGSLNWAARLGDHLGREL